MGLGYARPVLSWLKALPGWISLHNCNLNHETKSLGGRDNCQLLCSNDNLHFRKPRLNITCNGIIEQFPTLDYSGTCPKWSRLAFKKVAVIERCPVYST